MDSGVFLIYWEDENMRKKIVANIICIVFLVLIIVSVNTPITVFANDYEVYSSTEIREIEPNDELAEARYIDLDKIYVGSILGDDEYDYYRIKLEKDTTYKFAIGNISQNGHTFIQLRDPDGEYVETNIRWGTSPLSKRIFDAIDDQGMYYANFTTSVTGNYSIEFCNYYGNQKDYRFYIKKIDRKNESTENVTNKSSNGNATRIESSKDKTNEVEPNNELTEAKFIELDKMYIGSILGDDEYDYYRMKLEKGKNYKVAIGGVSQNGHTFIQLRDPEGLDVEIREKYSSTAIARAIYNAIDDQGMYYVTFTAQTSGNYYIAFINYYGEQKEYKFYIKCIDNSYSNEWIDGKWYNSDGTCTYTGKLEWKSNSNGWWVEDTSGWYPKDSWQKIDGTWYYFKPDGYMASSEYYGGYWFNGDGSWDETYYLTLKSNSTGWWVEDKSGWWPSTKWLKINGSWYYFDGSGYMVTNQYVDGYWIGTDGVCQ